MAVVITGALRSGIECMSATGAAHDVPASGGHDDPAAWLPITGARTQKMPNGQSVAFNTRKFYGISSLWLHGAPNTPEWSRNGENPYSARNATTGWSFAARRAGNSPAANATRPSRTATPPSVRGSDGSTP